MEDISEALTAEIQELKNNHSEMKTSLIKRDRILKHEHNWKEFNKYEFTSLIIL